jgi:hypothetical protein
MKNITTFICTILSVILFISCEETVKLDTLQAPSKIVIEGMVTNVAGNQFVKITKSTDFYQSGNTPRVTNATVTVQDDLGSIFQFVHNPKNESNKNGYYYPSGPFKGSIGRTYKLKVVADGQTYEAQDQMTRTMTFDSLTNRINEDEKKDPKVKGRYYQVLLYGKEPQETKDYYIFKYYRNDSLSLYNISDIYNVDDQGIGANVNGVTAPIYFGLNDKVRLEALSVSRNAFLYYTDLYNLINSDGGMFSAPPANPRSNISNGALGVFQASAIASKEIVIKP